MNFKLIEMDINEKDFPDQKEYAIYISRTEILKNEIDKLEIITEMLTSPCCYYSGWDNEDFSFVIDKFKSKTTNKGVYFVNYKNEETGNYELRYAFKKR